MWGPSAEVLDPRPGVRAEETRSGQLDLVVDEDESDGIDWDDPESWYDEGGSG
jgi:hypothetical protein